MSAPVHCKGCVLHWVHGKKDGVYNNWCCKYGKHAPKAVSHCKISGGKVTRGKNNEHTK